MRITALAGGYGGARFLLGLRALLRESLPDGSGGSTAEVTVVANTGDDLRAWGLQVCPDLDTLMYTLGGGISAERGWGREDETFVVTEELAAYGAGPDWFGLGDRDLATHLVRSQMLGAGYPLSAVTAALCARWEPGVRLLPMSDDRLETHVVVDGEEPGTRRALHFQEWWVRHRAALPAHEFVLVGVEGARPGPGVLDAIRDADVVMLPPSNPVVSIGTVLQVPGVREAMAQTAAPVVGVSPILGGAAVRGMAAECLRAIGVASDAHAVARHFGARRDGGLLDGWLVHDGSGGVAGDGDGVDELRHDGILARAVPLLMTDVDATRGLAAAALALATDVRAAA